MKDINNNHEGYIPVFRRFFKSSLWNEKRKFSRAEAWLDLLSMARYIKEPGKIIDRGETIIINYGEILTSIKGLSEKWQRSQSWVSRFLEDLEKDGSIAESRKKSRRTIIKIVNWEHFANLAGKTGAETGAEREQTPRTTIKKIGTKKEQNGSRTGHKNKDNKDNNNSKELLRKPSSYGNPLINFVLKEFEERWGYPPTDRKPRFEAHNLIRRINTYIRACGKEPTDEYVRRAVIFLLDKISHEDWAENIQTLGVIRRKMPIYLQPPKGGEQQ